MQDIETANDCLVGVTENGLVLFLPPRPKEIIDKAKALRLAAWLVTLANDDEAFEATRKAVRGT